MILRLARGTVGYAGPQKFLITKTPTRIVRMGRFCLLSLASSGANIDLNFECQFSRLMFFRFRSDLEGLDRLGRLRLHELILEARLVFLVPSDARLLAHEVYGHESELAPFLLVVDIGPELEPNRSPVRPPLAVSPLLDQNPHVGDHPVPSEIMVGVSGVSDGTFPALHDPAVILPLEYSAWVPDVDEESLQCFAGFDLRVGEMEPHSSPSYGLNPGWTTMPEQARGTVIS